MEGETNIIVKTLYISIIKFISDLQLTIDRGTYLTVIIGLLTVYAVALAFYQFTASFHGGTGTRAGTYLGINLVEYHMKKGLGICSTVISSRLFWVFFAAAILYKPIESIFGECFSEKIVLVLNFAWYVYCILFFLFFVFFFSRCTRSVMALKTFTGYVNTEGISWGESAAIAGINKKIAKKLDKKSIGQLEDRVDWIIKGIESTDPKYTLSYIRLIQSLMRGYLGDKQREIERLMPETGKKKSIVGWKYDFQRESLLLKKIQEAFAAAREYDKNIKMGSYIDLYLKMLETDMEIARREGYKHISFIPFSMDIMDKQTLELRDWSELTDRIFKKGEIADKKILAERLYLSEKNSNELTTLFCKKKLEIFLREYMDRTIAGDFEEKDFASVFGVMIKHKQYNLIFVEKLIDYMIDDNKFESAELPRLLDKPSCTYIAVYLLIYYSIYGFRGEWEYLNIKMMNSLIKSGKDVEESRCEIDGRLKKSDISHRYKTEMLDMLCENINKEVTWEWIQEIYRQNKVDPFYLTVVKLCVFNQRYQPDYVKRNPECEILFINRLVKHPEIMKCGNVMDMINMLHYESLGEFIGIPPKLKITLRSLLLLDSYLTDGVLDDERLKYSYVADTGQYLLVTSGEYKDITEIQKSYIKKAYEMKDGPVEEYVDNLYKECELCGKHLSYRQKERIRQNLINII